MVPDFGHYLARLRELPPGTAAKKAAMKLRRVAGCELEKAAARLSPAQISDGEFLHSLNLFASMEDALHAFRGERPSFFIQPSVRQELVTMIQLQFPYLVVEVVQEAEKVCQHVFDLLGSGQVNLDQFARQHGGGEDCGYLPWHHDFKTGYRWSPKKFYKKIEIPYGEADIKVPWELSRLQHAAVLGQAYWLTNDEKYAQEFVRQVNDWIESNPLKFGVNWSCTMDVAIRVANWIQGFYFFKDSRALTDEFLIKFTKSLLAHGRHIMANLENKGIANNHYISDLVGLIYLGIAFPEFKEACRWRDFGIQELIKEMGRQVYDDGMNFEASTCYHRLALELVFFPTILCRLNGIELPQTFIDKLKKMFDFVLYVLKPNGMMPQIGDNDNARLHILGKRDILDMTYLLSFAALYYDDAGYKINEFGFAPETLWLFGPEAYERWNKLPGRSVEELESHAFPDGGIYVMRHKKDYMAISCRPRKSDVLGCHAHDDALSFELCISGEDVVIDPGTYIYTANPEERCKFRSSVYHNMVTLVEQSRKNHLEEDAPIFGVLNEANACCLRWDDSKQASIFSGELYPSDGQDSRVVFRREIIHLKSSGKWTITDSIASLGYSKVEWRLCLARQASSVEVVSQELQWNLTSGWYSRGYGERSPCAWMTAVLFAEGALIARFTVRRALFGIPELDTNR